MKNQNYINSSNYFFYLENFSFIIFEILKFNISSFEQVLDSLKKPIEPVGKKLSYILIIKKIIRLLDFFRIRSCFVRSIILFKVLKKYNHSPLLHIGIKKEIDLDSHAWIEINNTYIDTSKGFKIFTTIK